MTEILHPGAGVLFMKVGTHADEPLDEIIKRKRREIQEAGYALWGYGGGTCHPLTAVQPFVRDFERRGSTVYLLMQPMVSRHLAVTERATQFSADGIVWQPIPKPINVIGSRYAFAINELKNEEFDLSLATTRVAAGISRGKPGDQYVKGRVDKACLEISDPVDPNAHDQAAVHIGFVARFVEPFAVIVK